MAFHCCTAGSKTFTLNCDLLKNGLIMAFFCYVIQRLKKEKFSSPEIVLNREVNKFLFLSDRDWMSGCLGLETETSVPACLGLEAAADSDIHRVTII